MTDWEDASRDELMARLDGALERLKLDADVEAALHFDKLIDEAPTYTWPPAPNTAHPGLAEQARFVRDMIAAGRHTVFLPGPRKSLARFITEPLDSVEPDFPRDVCLTVKRCWAMGVHVGEPYAWMWEVAADENGRWISSDSWPVYDPNEPWRRG